MKTPDLENRKLPTNNTSGVRGVSWDATYQAWRVRFQAFRTRISMGLYDDKDEAIAALREAQARCTNMRATRDLYLELQKTRGRRRRYIPKGYEPEPCDYPGVFWNKNRHQWEAQIHAVGRKRNIGYFDDVEDAIAARKVAENRKKSTLGKPTPSRTRRPRRRVNANGNPILPGVYYDKGREKWYAMIKIDGRSKYLGTFARQADAEAHVRKIQREREFEIVREQSE